MTTEHLGIMRNQVTYGQQTLSFRVRYLANMKSKVLIHVQPDQRIVIDAPNGTGMPKIKQALIKRARWVVQQQSKLNQLHRHALPRQYVSGETHWYLGRRHLLKVKISKTEKPGTKMHRGLLLVTTPEQDPALIKMLLHQWYLTRAKAVFDQRLTAVCPELHWVSQPPGWKLREMKKQWGSCSPKGKLSLNPLLVKAPRPCIDYVLIHELCHLKHHNHSDEFYRLLRSQLPDWEATKARLDNLSEQILK